MQAGDLGVITMNLLHSSIFDNDPLQDAIDLRELSNNFSDGRPVIYMWVIHLEQ